MFCTNLIVTLKANSCVLNVILCQFRNKKVSLIFARWRLITR